MVKMLDPLSFEKVVIDGGGWFRPKWNQGGYDAIFIYAALTLV